MVYGTTYDTAYGTAYDTAAEKLPLNISRSVHAQLPDKLPDAVLSDPALLFLYYRIEQILGIKAGYDALKKLNQYIEDNCKSTYLENPAAYEGLLISSEHIFEISKFVTINETYFFREELQFNLLASLLPQISTLNRPLQVCCAAVSIGCEAYSIAMLLDYYNNNKGLNIDFFIDAFDVDNKAIEIAKNAYYTANTIRNDGANLKYILDEYLTKKDDEFVVCENIKKNINFFSHNIMRGLEKQYDIIFFRNALIYFSCRNRLTIINNLCHSLFPGGLLFMGIAETSSVNHPLLESRLSSDVFYFQKTAKDKLFSKHIANNLANKNTETLLKKQHKQKTSFTNLATYHTPSKYKEIPINCSEIANILKIDEGEPNAQNILNTILLISDETNSSEINFSKINFREINSNSQLAAAVMYFLNVHDLVSADKVLTILEKRSKEAYTKFLRGEYFFLLESAQEAEIHYQEAAVKNKLFWPAFYRIAVLACEGNTTRYEYKIKKTIDSIKLSLKSEHSKELYYECFLGGFSPDYFLRILEKKLTEIRGIE